MKNIITNSLFASLISILGFIALFSSVSTNAAAPKYTGKDYTPNTNILNIRNKNCDLVGSVTTRAVIQDSSSVGVKCKIDGVTYTMKAVLSAGNNVYVADKFVTQIVKPTNSKTTFTKVNAINGVNVRNSNGNVIGLLANNSNITITAPNYKVMKINDKYYAMYQINYNGQVGFVAGVFLS